ncbi:MAG: PIN domain-containing protein [Bacteroidetes bacterium]|nr:PIN domain-containing protein [Bacteroidota bacterium]MBU1372575.1 PIN domain-containing protein [Bacteroidota bacterium]MBU1485016.1 PIN domain-containing protein [Bacteroidota bacterium]MBU1760339.1 PIN domain-containing protein [Bacteroidota bacterium]MBU2046605.1 PIN domain-containing protein [Bacteroidota bacterium]
MIRIFIDTNIILDLLANRKDFYLEAQQLFTLADHKEVELYTSSLSIVNTHYILSQKLKQNEINKTLRQFKLLVSVLNIDDKIIDLALNSDFKDFEDAVQYECAIQNQMDIIITRNLKDFKLSKIPILSAKDYLSTF